MNHGSVSAGGLVGRKAELDEVRGAVERAMAGSTEVVVLAGEPGIGKTAIARTVADEAEDSGIAVAWSSCWAMDHAPAYWPWKSIVASLRGSDEIAAAIREGLSPPDVFERLSPFLRSKADAAPVLVVLDDAHGADDAALALVALCGRSFRNVRLAFLLTVCEEDVPHGSRRAKVLDAIGRGATRVDLFGLSRADTLSFFTRLAGEPPGLVAEGIVSASEGNPFLIEQVARELRATGDIRRPDRSLGFKVPKGAHAVTDRILQRLPADAISLLAEAAVVGRTFSASLLSELDEGKVPVSRILDDAVAGAAVRPVDSLGRYEFTHTLLREALYEGLGSERRSELHHRIAEILSALDAQTHLAEIAHHRFKAGLIGDTRETLRVLSAAAEQARALGSEDEAVRLAYRAHRYAAAAGLPIDEIEVRALEPSPPPAAGSASLSGAVFAREGEIWTVAFGGTTARLKDSKGLRHLARLLGSPGREFHSLDLVAGEEGSIRMSQTDTGPLIDDRARASYKRRLEDIEDEIAEAEATQDDVRRERAENEKDFLIKELQAATGLGGRARHSGSDSERARVSVTRAIRSALRRVAAANGPLGEHLDRAVRTGTFVSYDPDPNSTPRWIL